MRISRVLSFAMGIVAATVVTASCGRPADPTDADVSLTGTRWVVDSVVSSSSTQGPSVGHEAYVIFDGGVFRGSTGCVPVNGQATIIGDRITMTISGAPTCAGTDVALHDALVNALRGEVRYRIVWQTLTLSAPNGTEVRLRAS